MSSAAKGQAGSFFPRLIYAFHNTKFYYFELSRLSLNNVAGLPASLATVVRLDAQFFLLFALLSSCFSILICAAKKTFFFIFMGLSFLLNIRTFFKIYNVYELYFNQ